MGNHKDKLFQELKVELYKETEDLKPIFKIDNDQSVVIEQNGNTYKISAMPYAVQHVFAGKKSNQALDSDTKSSGD